MKAPLYYLHKKTQEVKLTFDMIARAIKFITRADDRTKTIGNKNTKFLIHAIEQEIEANGGKPVFIDHDFISKITDCLNDQNAILLKRLADIFDAQYKHCIRYKGKLRHRGYMVQYTETGKERLKNPELFYDTNNELKQQKAKILRPIKIGASADKNRCTTYKEKEIEIEDIPQGYISSISQEKKEYARAANNETSPYAALPNLRGSSICEFLAQPRKAQESKPTDPAKPTKPRLVITAAMQKGTVPMPLPLQTKEAATSEVKPISTNPSPPPVLPVPPVLPPMTPPTAMTAEQEREQSKRHRDRRQDTVSDTTIPIGATILSLLPRLGLEAEPITNTHQKGIEFQATVETSKACSTSEHSITTKVEPNSERQTQVAIGKEKEENKMAALPYRDEEPYWAKDLKTQMTSDCQFEHEIDFWEYKASLRLMDLEQDTTNKLLTFKGSSLSIRYLRRDHFKTFVAKFYEALPDYEFKLLEEKKQ